MPSSSQEPQLVYVDGRGERWRPIGMQLLTTVQSEETGAVTVIDSLRSTDLGIEMDGRLMRPVGEQPKANCT